MVLYLRLDARVIDAITAESTAKEHSVSAKHKVISLTDGHVATTTLLVAIGAFPRFLPLVVNDSSTPHFSYTLEQRELIEDDLDVEVLPVSLHLLAPRRRPHGCGEVIFSIFLSNVGKYFFQSCAVIQRFQLNHSLSQ